ncbi:MAG: hypothetical protein GF364_11455 [Candidatus Lokiarchaeota archaeon]|nr:hypothetical protein [Candidatus Lokiarchaeota archaeon]
MSEKQLKVLYSNLKNSDFFNFFNCQEKDSTIKSEDIIKKTVEPGAFQENIQIEININKKDEIIKSELMLARKWIGNKEHLNMFANDIAKSFILANTPRRELKKTQKLAECLFQTHGTKDKVISIHQETEDGGNETSVDISNIIETYVGNKEASRFNLSSSSFKLNNILFKGEKWLQIVYEY